jgi:hypothetical protein
MEHRMARPLEVKLLGGEPDTPAFARAPLSGIGAGGGGVSEFGDLSSLGVLNTPAVTSAPDSLKFGSDLSKVNLASGVGDVRLEPKMDPRKTLTNEQNFGLETASTAFKTAGALSDIKDAERTAIGRLERKFADEEVTRMLNTVDTNNAIVARNLHALKLLQDQAGAAQTSSRQHQQFFNSPTRGTSI